MSNAIVPLMVITSAILNVLKGGAEDGERKESGKMSRLTDYECAYCFMRCVEEDGDEDNIRENCRIYKSCLERKAYDKLVHYEDLEEQGRLIELPCKVGSKLYFITISGEIWTMPIRSVEDALFYKDKIGVGYYLTRAEAETKLAKLKEGGGDE